MVNAGIAPGCSGGDMNDPAHPAAITVAPGCEARVFAMRAAVPLRPSFRLIHITTGNNSKDAIVAISAAFQPYRATS